MRRDTTRITIVCWEYTAKFYNEHSAFAFSSDFKPDKSVLLTIFWCLLGCQVSLSLMRKKESLFVYLLLTALTLFRLTMVCGWYNWIYCNLYLVLLGWLDIKCITRSNILTSRFLYSLLKLTLFCQRNLIIVVCTFPQHYCRMYLNSQALVVLISHTAENHWYSILQVPHIYFKWRMCYFSCF